MVPDRDENNEIIGHEIYPANFVFPKKGRLKPRVSRKASWTSGEA